LVHCFNVWYKKFFPIDWRPLPFGGPVHWHRLHPPKAGPAAAAGKGGHLWEFIRHLLKTSEDPSDGSSAGVAFGEKIIQWEDRAEGVFRIVNSKAVAKLWGEQKDNRKTKMTYEKLSRALRSVDTICPRVQTT
jgi:hypothetical protein